MINKIAKYLLLLFSAVMLQNVSAQKNNTDYVLYRQSIQNAMYPDVSKIDTQLVAVNKQNKNLTWATFDGVDYILVVTWKQNVSYYQKYIDSAFYNTGNYPIWITTAPELLQRMKKENPTDITDCVKTPFRIIFSILNYFQITLGYIEFSSIIHSNNLAIDVLCLL